MEGDIGPVEGPTDVVSDAPPEKVLAGRELGQSWLAIPAAARLVAKQPRSGRETVFLGPGRVLPCLEDENECWLAKGIFESVLGAGEAPGGEEWVVTPHGVVRYGAARLRIEVGPTETHVTVVTGVAFAWPPSDAGPSEGWQRLSVGGSRALGPRSEDGRDHDVSSASGARSAVVDCASQAERTARLTNALFAGVADGAAALVSDQVIARRVARAACAVAALRTRALSPETPAPDVANLREKLEKADRDWRSLARVRPE